MTSKKEIFRFLWKCFFGRKNRKIAF